MVLVVAAQKKTGGRLDEALSSSLAFLVPATGNVLGHPKVGIDVSTPVRMPVGHRDVIVLSRV